MVMQHPAKVSFRKGRSGSSPDVSAINNTPVAQLVEQWTDNPCVTGSSPVRSTKRMITATHQNYTNEDASSNHIG